MSLIRLVNSSRRSTAQPNLKVEYEDTGEPVHVTAEVQPASPIWSGDARSREAASGRETPRFSDSAEVEVIEREPVIATNEARGRRRNPEASPSLTPEPRVEINDPQRDASEKTIPGESEHTDEPMGAEEVRADDLKKEPSWRTLAQALRQAAANVLD